MLCQQMEQCCCTGLHGTDHDEVASRRLNALAAVYVEMYSIDVLIADLQGACDMR